MPTSNSSTPSSPQQLIAMPFQLFSGWVENKLLINPAINTQWQSLEPHQQEELSSAIINAILGEQLYSIDSTSLENFLTLIHNRKADIIRALYHREFETAATCCRRIAPLDGTATYLLAYMIESGNISAKDDDFACTSLEMPSNATQHEQATLLYQKAVSLGYAGALSDLAYLINCGHIKATNKEFEYAGLNIPPNTTRHEQAAVLYRKALAPSLINPIFKIIYMIYRNQIRAIESDFAWLGLTMPLNATYLEQAAILYQNTAPLDLVGCFAIYNLAMMIEGKETEAIAKNYEFLGLDLSKANQEPEILSTILFFMASINGLKAGTDQFTRNFRKLLESNKYEIFFEIILAFLISRPKTSLPADLFQYLVEKRGGITQYLCSPTGKAQWASQKEQLVDNKNALGCIINCDPESANRDKIFSSNKTQTAQLIIQEYSIVIQENASAHLQCHGVFANQERQRCEDMLGSALIGDCDL